MTLLPAKILAGEVEAPDLFCGGTPCQAFSVAGLRNSLDDARGNLSLTFCEIANAIDNRRSVRGESPSIVFWENVPGVLNTKDNAFGCFLGALAGEDEALIAPGGRWTNAGFIDGPQRAVAWRVLDAQYFGVAQRRRRVFVVASARDDFNPAEVLFEFEGVRRDTAPSRQARQEVAGTIAARFGISRNNIEECVPVVGALDTECGGNKLTHQSVKNGHVLAVGVSPDGKDTVGTLMARDYKGIGNQDLEDGRGLVLEPISFHPTQDPITSTDGTTHGLGCGSSGGQASIAVAFNIAPGKGALKDDIHVTNAYVSKTIDASGSNPSMHQGGAAIVWAADLSQKAEGIGYKKEQAPCLAVGTHPGHGAHVHAVMETVAPTLTASNDPSRSPQSTEVTNQVAAIHSVSMAVRRLTPTECERLQGFPDGYTNIPWRKAAESPDGPRYKALGNSWAVPVVAWIGKRIQERITT
jgi:DNA (cytosine-5)-methyltransferase 1